MWNLAQLVSALANCPEMRGLSTSDWCYYPIEDEVRKLLNTFAQIGRSGTPQLTSLRSTHQQMSKIYHRVFA